MKLSVVMCTYNGAAYLPAQLASIARQTRQPDELVICDDCSSDETLAVAEAFAASAAIPVRLYVNEQNLGSTRSFERAIGLCTGEVIALCDQDDVWRSDKLELIEEAFAKTPAAGLLFSDAEVVDENLAPLGPRMWERLGFDRNQQQRLEKGRTLEVLMPGWTVTGATMAFRSKYNRLFLPIPPEIPMIHDGWISLVIGGVAKVILLDEPLIKYRQHSAQQVGAPARVERQKRWRVIQAIDASLHRSTSFVDLRIILTTLRERLSDRGEMFPGSKALSYIDDYISHLDARENLAPGKLRRLPVILHELIRLSYHRYSNGFYSAAKDLVT